MLKTLKRVTYQVDDTTKAKEWYSALLQKEPHFTSPFAVLFTLGECTLSLLKGEQYAVDGFDGNVSYWEVDHIEESFETLLKAGAKVHTPIKKVMNIKTAKVVDPFGNTIGITSNSDHCQSGVEQEVSESAMVVTFSRALSTYDVHEELQGADNLAPLFLSDNYKQALYSIESRYWAKEKVGNYYGYIMARTAYGDSLFKEALKERVPQIVLLGAGFDTRVYRYASLNEGTRIFEIDTPTTQGLKVSKLAEADIDIPSSVCFVGANFEKDSLADMLSVSGYDPNVKTLFILEGVSCYLGEEAVRNIFSFIQHTSGTGSQLYFDFLTEEQVSFFEAEPFKYWKDTVQMSALLKEFDISVSELFTPKEIEKEFLTCQDGTVAERTIPHFSLLLGEKR